MPLAKNGDPFIKGNGELIESDHVSEPDAFMMEEQRKILPLFSKYNPTRYINIEDIPEPDEQLQVVIAAIIGLRMMGLSPSDTAEMMNTSLERLQSIVKTPASQTSFEKIFQNIVHVNSETVQGRIASYAHKAVDTVVELMDDQDTRDDVRLKAAQDLLDRSGTNADQFFQNSENKKQSDDELRIVIMDEEGEKEKIKVEIGKKRG